MDFKKLQSANFPDKKLDKANMDYQFAIAVAMRITQLRHSDSVWRALNVDVGTFDFWSTAVTLAKDAASALIMDIDGLEDIDNQRPTIDRLASKFWRNLLLESYNRVLATRALEDFHVVRVPEIEQLLHPDAVMHPLDADTIPIPSLGQLNRLIHGSSFDPAVPDSQQLKQDRVSIFFACSAVVTKLIQQHSLRPIQLLADLTALAHADALGEPTRSGEQRLRLFLDFLRLSLINANLELPQTSVFKAVADVPAAFITAAVDHVLLDITHGHWFHVLHSWAIDRVVTFDLPSYSEMVLNGTAPDFVSRFFIELARFPHATNISAASCTYHVGLIHWNCTTAPRLRNRSIFDLQHSTSSSEYIT